jgi:hypothetical protein
LLRNRDRHVVLVEGIVILRSPTCLSLYIIWPVIHHFQWTVVIIPFSFSLERYINGWLMLQNHIDWLIDDLLFCIPLKNCSLIWIHHHFGWRASRFGPILRGQGLWTVRGFIVPHLLWQRA